MGFKSTRLKKTGKRDRVAKRKKKGDGNMGGLFKTGIGLVGLSVGLAAFNSVTD